MELEFAEATDLPIECVSKAPRRRDRWSWSGNVVEFGQQTPASRLSRWPCHDVLARAYLGVQPKTRSVGGYMRRRGRAAEGGGLLNRYRVVKPYRGFESLRLRHSSS
jgi:hypothetical protein